MSSDTIHLRALHVGRRAANQARERLREKDILYQGVRTVQYETILQCDTEKRIAYPIKPGDQALDVLQGIVAQHDAENAGREETEWLIGWADFPVIKKKKQNNRDVLRDILTPDEMKEMVTTHAIIGDVLIIPIPETLNHKARAIAEAKLDSAPPSVKIVCMPRGPHEGEYRTQQLRILAGEDRDPLVTTHTEYGARLKMDLQKVFYSIRLTTDRHRIATDAGARLKNGNDDTTKESVGCFFAGVGPYPILIARGCLEALAPTTTGSMVDDACVDSTGTDARHSPPPCVQVVAFELNPDAIKYMRENVHRAGLDTVVTVVAGDVRDTAPHYSASFTRITMPIPHYPGCHDFLPECLPTLADGGICHFYFVIDLEHSIEYVRDLIAQRCRENDLGCTIVLERTIRQFSTASYQVVIDFVVKRHGG